MPVTVIHSPLTSHVSRLTFSQASQSHPADRVVGPLLQDQMGPFPGGQNVFPQIHPVDLFPDLACKSLGLRLGELRVLSKIRLRVPECRLPQPAEPLEEPFPDV